MDQSTLAIKIAFLKTLYIWIDGYMGNVKLSFVNLLV